MLSKMALVTLPKVAIKLDTSTVVIDVTLSLLIIGAGFLFASILENVIYEFAKRTSIYDFTKQSETSSSRFFSVNIGIMLIIAAIVSASVLYIRSIYFSKLGKRK
jgi:hypothetical protein